MSKALCKSLVVFNSQRINNVLTLQTHCTTRVKLSITNKNASHWGAKATNNHNRARVQNSTNTQNKCFWMTKIVK